MKISGIFRFAFKKASIIAVLSLLFTGFAFASGAVSAEVLDLTTHPVGYLSLLIPVMFAVLTMEPEMSQGQWLLATLTAGVCGSMLSIGSAAGIALMGQARGKYTFFGHLKWSWAIALGYAASIVVHMFINKNIF